MNYSQTIDYLYHAAPLFQNIGAGAYKEGLATTRELDAHFGHPHRRYHTIHVAGTNGKGSVSSSLAAVLQSSGLRVGLYTSPHLVDFRERIRVNGEMIPEQRVVDFVERERGFFEPLHPSFFELTTALAFLYFAEQEIDVAVVEVGLGGRLDCTNIIRPDLSVITNISLDHQQFLGSTLPAIAAEKAGVIKKGVPVVVGETNGHDAVRDVFLRAFRDANGVPSPSDSEASDVFSGNSDGSSGATVPSLRFADEEPLPDDIPLFQLSGSYQQANLRTILCALSELQQQPFYAPLLTSTAVREGLSHVMELTGLRGRWQQLREAPTIVCDAGHNVAGIQYVVCQLLEQRCKHLRVVFGMVNDKDFSTAVRLLSQLCLRPNSAFCALTSSEDNPAFCAATSSEENPPVTFYFTQPSCARALSAEVLAEAFCALLPKDTSRNHVLTFPSVSSAVEAALSDSDPDDFIFVGGSCYVVADLFASERG
ncbi:MAG: bifunctional folylpolyglutamate synthase/dihydrofolate synthase [Bacteroidaceae bacterium]|nr:bifunctional folylpolyglutamate synthase/dihydrofolate synthase [Bacteroidaceae bacterium]